MAGISPETSQTRAGPVTIPARSAARQAKSRDVAGWIRPTRMPVAPITRPSVSISRVEATPIRMPPDNEASGVNAVSIIGSARRS